MIIIENKSIADIPLLHVVEQKNNDKSLPFILFIHGFESVKENNLHYAYLLANKGFRVVMPEAIYHGERQTGLNSLEMNIKFWEIVTKTIDELQLIKDYYESENKIIPNQIGLAGTSMGGIITLGALTQYSWIKAAVSLMGMPYYEQFSQYQIEQFAAKGVKLPFTEQEKEAILEHLRTYDLSMQTEKLNERPLLFWHGMKDPIVPYKYTYQFYESIKPLYQHSPENLQFITDEKADHKVSRVGVLKLVEWLEKHVKEAEILEITK